MAGTGSIPEVRIVHGEPGGVATLLRAALPSIPVVNLLPGIRKTGDFSGLALTRPAVTLERALVTSYSGVCGFPVKDTVPLTYPHLLAFPLHMAILADPGFPFAAVGAIHLANSITAYRRLAVGETVTVTTRADEVLPHPKGRTVDFVTTVDAGGEVVWESTSTYLRRGRGDEGAVVADGPTRIPPGRVTWRLPADPRTAVRRRVGRPQPDPPLPADRQGARVSPPDSARHVEPGPLCGRRREPVAGPR